MQGNVRKEFLECRNCTQKVGYLKNPQCPHQGGTESLKEEGAEEGLRMSEGWEKVMWDKSSVTSTKSFFQLCLPEQIHKLQTA